VSLLAGADPAQLTGMRISILSAILLLAVAPAALAADKDKDAKDVASGQYVNVSPVAAPIVLNGRLINYIFVTLRVDLAPNVDALRMRDREPYFRDAFVRVAHRHPFVKPGDYTHVDERALKAAMMVESARIAGPHVVTGIDIISAQPQKVTGLPRPEGPPAPRAPIP
jgi:hypothetical protein